MSKDLTSYRLPEFWRDASVVWAALPATWVGARGLHSDLLLFEALSGVLSPAATDFLQFETLFHGDIDIRRATLCWEYATLYQTVFIDHGKRVIDRTPRPLLEAPLKRLLDDFGSACALRKAALAFVDTMLAESDPAPAHLELFFVEREAFANEIALDWERTRSACQWNPTR